MNVILSWLFECSLNFRADNHLRIYAVDRGKKKWKIVLKAFFFLSQWQLEKNYRLVQIYGGKLSILRAQQRRMTHFNRFSFSFRLFRPHQMQRCIFQRNSKNKTSKLMRYKLDLWLCFCLHCVCSHRKEKMSFSARTCSWAQLYHSLSPFMCLSAKDYRCH